MLTIDRRPITVTADAKSKTYGNADPVLTYRVTSGSLVNGDSLSGSLQRAAGENAGSYTISAADLADGNYVVTAQDGTLTIDRRPITVTVDYMRGGIPTDTFAEAVVERLGNRIANVEAVAWQRDRAKPIAAARINFLLERP